MNGDDIRLTFSQPREGSRWISSGPDGHGFVEVCNPDFRSYVGVPPACREFDVVISAAPPEGGHDFFTLVPDPCEDHEEGGKDRIGLDLVAKPGFYLNTRRFMKTLWDNDYRYVRVEF